jgi:hypothetical protein
MVSPSKEAREILALNALRKNPKLRLSATADIYFIPYNTLRNRRAGRPTRRDIPANLHKLTDLEENTIIQYII